MKQIILSDEIRGMAEEYARSLFANKRPNFVQPKEGLKNLQTDIIEINDGLADKAAYMAYIEKIIDEFEALKKMQPSRFEKKKEEFDELLPPGLLSTDIKVRVSRLPDDKVSRMRMQSHSVKFFEEVVARLRYKDARPVLAKYMMGKIGIQTCVYCNNADATYSEELQEAYYHLDHWRPKDQYPFLSVCFFNLYPCCANCNDHKLDGSKGSFQLYADLDAVADPFMFVINRKGYEVMNPETLSVEFNARSAHDNEYCEEYNNVYRIKEVYNSPTSLRHVEKLLYDIDKHRCSYSNATNKSFPGIVDKNELFHFVLGVDSDENNIFTDVKKKLKLDTARDAKLI